MPQPAEPARAPSPPEPCRAQWFDGTQARAQPVRVQVQGTQLLLHRAEDIEAKRDPEHGTEQTPDGHPAPTPPLRSLALRAVAWPERTRHGQRVAQLPDGGSLVFDDAAAFDAWRAAQGHRDSWVVRAQQRWRGALLAVLGLVALSTAGFVWGVPWVASAVVAVLPAEVDRVVGDRALAQLQSLVLKPTRTALPVQEVWRERLQTAIAAAYPPEQRVPWTLHFAGGGPIKANALAMPGGHIVVTDELLALLHGADDALLGVLAHEYGHVQRRHGMHAVVRVSIVSAAASAALGDVSGVVAGLPVVFAQLAYSRDAEREADADAAHVLLASGRDPAAMATLFERLSERRGKPDDKGTGQADEGANDPIPIAFASHPADEDRIRFFREYRESRQHNHRAQPPR